MQIKYQDNNILKLTDQQIQNISVELKNRFGQVKAIYIADKDQKKIMEYYRPDFLTENYVQIIGATDGILSLLVGAVIKSGLFSDTKIKIKDILNADISSQIDSHEELELHHLLTMSSGIDWPPPIAEFNPPFQDIKILNSLHSINRPGEKFVYKPDPHIIMCMLEETTGISISDVAGKYLFHKMGINDYLWELTYKGYQGMYIKIPDLAKFGALVLNDGKWKGEQLVDEKYFQQAMNFQINGDFPETNDFGYLWWLLEVNGLRCKYTSGYGGQYLFTVPDMGITIIIISEVERPHPVNKELIVRYLLGNQ